MFLSRLKTYKNKLFLLSLLSLWTAFLFSVLVVDFDKHHPLFRFRETVTLSYRQVERALELKPDYYLLKIIHNVQNGQSKNVIFNGEVISAFKVLKKNISISFSPYTDKVTDYFRVFPNQIRKNNSLKINFHSSFPEEVTIRLQNYRHAPVSNGIVTFFRPAVSHLVGFTPLRLISVFLLVYLFEAAILLLAKEAQEKIALYIILTLNICVSVIAINNFLPLTPYVIFIAAHYFRFWFVLVVSFIIALLTSQHITSFIICKKILYSLPQKTRRVIISVFAASITSFFLLNAMWTLGLYPTEVFDEAAQTFTEIPMVHKAFLNGCILKMNFFDNFGTPLLGAPVNNPFALHAVPYFFFEPHVTIIVNKTLLSISTFLVLFFFYRRRNLSFYSSLLVAFLTYTAPSFFWFFQHHSHQGVLFYFSCILLLMDLTYSKPRKIYWILLHISFVVFFLSSSIMGIFLGLPFLLLFSLMTVKCKIKPFVKLFVLPLISAIILTHPHILYFIRIAPSTWRSNFVYDIVNPYSFKDLLRGCTFLTTDITGYHTDYSINYSLVALIFAILGLLTCKNIRNNSNFIFSMILGVLPFLLVIILLRYRWIQSLLPVIKSVDVTRTLWFATIFLMIPLGLMFDKLTHRKISLVSTKYLIILLAPLLFLIVFVIGFAESYVNILIYILSPMLILLIYYFLIRYYSESRAAFDRFSILLFILLVLPRVKVYHRLATSCSNPKEMMSYAPLEFVEHMEPYYRLSSCQMPSHDEPRYASPDQKIAKYNILGSAGRSIIAHGDFQTFLKRDDLISFGWLKMLYYFKPNSPAKLGPFGIRYFVSQSKDSVELEKLGWQKKLKVEDLVLWENPLKPSPFYYISGSQIHFVHNFKFFYDRIEIEIPSVDCDNLEIVATFISWPGWRAKLDGKSADILKKEDQFIRVDCTNGKRLILEFLPYSNFYIIICSILSVVFMLLCCLLLSKPSMLKRLCLKGSNVKSRKDL